MHSFDTKLLAEGVTAALLEAGYTIVKVGSVPFWMGELMGEPDCYYVKEEFRNG